ncbi:hypothetical protein ES319_A01G061600v1 [Gossypium barbadense]|uniref:Uncharacterized protein n=2 Tax=Gossypium TaxID=3633 RepID=A0A5J5WWR7_GOSBA|nr:hypothetical protein ES319_A01G061600v1 [Gossypium barbadense]TYH30109.1 hypothetical protein ES288_A01G067300v1 [Gossypium darwinii]
MEATFLAKRALFNIPKFLSQGPPPIQFARRLTRACLSSAYERAEGSNAVAEAEGSSADDAPRDSMYETKHPSFVTGEGRPPGNATSFAADTAKDGIKKAVGMAENVGDTAKKALDGAWRAARDGAQGIKERVVNQTDEDDEDDDEIEEDVAVDEIRKVDQLVDTQEYRSIEESKKMQA